MCACMLYANADAMLSEKVGMYASNARYRLIRIATRKRIASHDLLSVPSGTRGLTSGSSDWVDATNGLSIPAHRSFYAARASWMDDCQGDGCSSRGDAATSWCGSVV